MEINSMEVYMETLFELSEISGVFTDAALTDDTGNLLFISVWGRDIAMQELLGRLQLPKSENGIRELTIQRNSLYKKVQIPNVDDLDKTAYKVTKPTIYGELAQMWIYNKIAITPDLSNHRALMLYADDDKKPELWPLVKSVCHLPLLDHWKDAFIKKCFDNDWIRYLDNGFGIKGVFIELNDQVEDVMSQMIQNYQLTLPDEYNQQINDAPEPVKPKNDSHDSLFGESDIVSIYSREQAIADGYLVDVSEISREAGFKFPVALTRTVWDDCVEWDYKDTERQTYQDQEGRLWDVVYMAANAGRQSSSSELEYQLYRVPRGGRGKKARLISLKSQIGPGDNGEPVITIMKPDED